MDNLMLWLVPVLLVTAALLLWRSAWHAKQAAEKAKEAVQLLNELAALRKARDITANQKP